MMAEMIRAAARANPPPRQQGFDIRLRRAQTGKGSRTGLPKTRWVTLLGFGRFCPVTGS